MTEIEEGWHTIEDGKKLYTKTWKTDGPPRARLVFVHGFSDHCNAYYDLFPTLASKGIQVHAFDQRGWGRSVLSSAERGNSGRTPQVLGDLTSFLLTLLPSPTPVFLMGHSMGGAVVLTYAATGPDAVRNAIRGYLAEAPFIGFGKGVKPLKIKVVLGRLAAKLAPKHQMLNRIPESYLSRDERVRRDFVEDELCHDLGTLEQLADMLSRAADLEGGRVVVKEGTGEGGKMRLWIGHGTTDQVCDFEATRRWFESLEVEDKALRTYEGWVHKLHAEPGSDGGTFANDVAEWILERCGAPAHRQEEPSLTKSPPSPSVPSSLPPSSPPQGEEEAQSGEPKAKL